MESKPYLVIARKYRPQTFDDLIGQDAISTTLKNAITLNRVGHAYLFTGPRGVGKTSTARIFAKALNCEKGPTVTPCGKCRACSEIEGARALDVLEIDGASNRGIDEVRALRENAKFAPAVGKYKIYIIDEVHQITTDGFNALLKTLEEPPPHVKFIFATTSVNKVPATILSRCQRFDFRRITTETIAGVLKEICKKEKIKVDDEALFMIAKAADGSLRDSQSILDQIAASAGEKIAKKEVVASLGSLEEERLTELMQALAEKDAKQALFTLNDLLNEGKEPSLLMEKLLEHVRNLLFLQVSPELTELVDAGESYKKDLLKQKEAFTRDELFYFFSVIAHTLQTMKRFEMKRVPLEIAIVKLAQKAPMRAISEILEELKTRPAEPTTRPVVRPSAAPVSAPAPAFRKYRQEETDEAEPDLTEIDEMTGPNISTTPKREAKNISLENIWHPLIGAVKSERISIASFLAEGEPVSYSNGIVRISFPEKLDFHRETLEAPENKKFIEKHLAVLLAAEVRVEFELVKELKGTVKAAPDGGGAPAKAAVSDGVIQSAMNIFGGRIIGS